MADTSVVSALTEDQWADGYFREFVRQHQFAKYTGKSVNAPIQMVEDLTKKAGDEVTVALVTRLTNSGVTGDNTLRGNEEALGNYGHKLAIDQERNAVIIGKREQKKTRIDMLKAAKPMLKMWDMENLRSAIIDAMQSANVDGVTAYASCTEAQKDAWVTANDGTVGRVLFGNAIGNQSGVDHSDSLLTIDATNDTLDRGIISLAKRMARRADPHMRPIQIDGGGEWYIMFAQSWAFRDLVADLASTHASARERAKSNPLYQDGDEVYNGVIIKEIPEIDVISGVGAGSPAIDVAPNFLCGAQAVGIAMGERPHPISEVDDYGNMKGVGIAFMRGVEKLMFNDIQHGTVTVYTAGVADS